MAANKTVVTCGPPIPMEVTSPSGYVTLVKADGSGLIFSTFFSGTKTDNVSFAALTGRGFILPGRLVPWICPGSTAQSRLHAVQWASWPA